MRRKPDDNESTVIISRVEVRFTATYEDLRDVLRSSLVPRSTWYTFIAISFLFLLFLVGIYLIDQGLAAVGYTWLVISALMGLALYEVPRIQQRHAMSRNPFVQGEITVSFQDDGVSTVYSAGKSQVEWRALSEFKETSRSFLLFFSPSKYTFIPKRVMSQEEIDKVRGILQSHIPPK